GAGYWRYSTTHIRPRSSKVMNTGCATSGSARTCSISRSSGTVKVLAASAGVSGVLRSDILWPGEGAGGEPASIFVKVAANGTPRGGRGEGPPPPGPPPPGGGRGGTGPLSFGETVGRAPSRAFSLPPAVVGPTCRSAWTRGSASLPRFSNEGVGRG